MADAAVEFLLENLKQLLLYNVGLIRDIKDDVEKLYKEISLFKAFLKDSAERRHKHETLKEIVKQIRDVVYEAEDAIDEFVYHAAVHKARKGLEKALHVFDHPAKLRNIAKNIEGIRLKVKDIYEKKKFGFEGLYAGDVHGGGVSAKKPPIVEEDNVVGFQDEADKVINLLTEGTDELEVTSIVGMPGLGKTTLAKMIYRDPRIEYEFYSRAWAYVSQDYSKKEVYLSILSSLCQTEDSASKMTEETLAKKLHETLEKGKYFIVLDDVWTEKAWNDLKSAFPRNKNRSRILLTSRINTVAKRANPNKEPHNLRFLTPEESWTLLKKKALGSSSAEECPSELLKYGKHISKECGGLPLAIVVIGGILLEKGTDWWEQVAKSVDAYITMDQEKRMDSFIGLSYDHLPYHLRACFVYLGIFPEDYEIPVYKLVRLWIAEGFVQQQREEGMSLEDVAEEYLQELINRNLVMVGNFRSNGKIKTCRIHDMLHEFCKREAAEDKFFAEVRRFEGGPSNNPASEKYRRLCVHSRALDYVSGKPVGPRVRSFLCYASEETLVPLEHVSSFVGAFKLLRVLDGRSLSFARFPADIAHVVHLRYVVLSGEFKVIPSSFSSLWNLQTLVVETSSRTLEIKADVWKMIQLRHVKLNASAKVSSGPLSESRKGAASWALQTLSTVSPESCTELLFARAPNLRAMGVRGQLAKLVEGKGFDGLGKLAYLENLKLLNDVFPRPPSEGRLTGLPQKYKFPPKLRKLTLSNTLLDWKDMSVLGMLETLEILKLKDNAFAGRWWEPEEGGFRSLRVLCVGKTDLVTWNASGQHFPKLRQLFLRHCGNLDGVPLGFADISSLKLLDLYCTSPNAASSARKIQEKKNKSLGEHGSGFKLAIYPPDL